MTLALQIRPDYAEGFSFRWSLPPTFNKPFPWVFTIGMAPTPAGDWTTISPQLVNVFAWSSPRMMLVNKSNVLYFKVTLKSGGETFESDVIQPFGDLTKKEFLIGKDIMRREVLQDRQFCGVPNKLLMKAQWGERCQTCTDPITGRVRNSNCPDCVGTGYKNPYHGPYDLWMSYSPDVQHRQVESPDTGTTEPKNFTARCVASPEVRQNDVVIDVRSNKRYYVSSVQAISEIRRIPIIQSINLAEAATSDPIYRLKV